MYPRTRFFVRASRSICQGDISSISEREFVVDARGDTEFLRDRLFCPPTEHREVIYNANVRDLSPRAADLARLGMENARARSCALIERFVQNRTSIVTAGYAELNNVQSATEIVSKRARPSIAACATDFISGTRSEMQIEVSPHDNWSSLKAFIYLRESRAYRRRAN